MSPPLSLELIRAFPKAELHRHIDGSLSPEDLFRIAQNHKRTVTSPNGKEVFMTVDDLVRFWRGSGYDRLIEEIIPRFAPVVQVMQTRGSIRDVCYTVARDLAMENILYAEYRFAPTYHLGEGLSVHEVISAVLEGFADAKREFGVETRLILGIKRHELHDGDIVARAAVEYAKQGADAGVVGIDLCCDEGPYPAKLFASAYQATLAAENLRRTVHAGEAAKTLEQNISNMKDSVSLLHADGLGHAVPLPQPDAAAVLRTVKLRGVRVEANPVSNMVTGVIRDIKDLQLDKLLSEGVLVSVNSDDPAMWTGGSLSETLYATALAYGWGWSEIEQLQRNALKSAFLPVESVREELLQRFEQRLLEFKAKYGIS